MIKHFVMNRMILLKRRCYNNARKNRRTHEDSISEENLNTIKRQSVSKKTIRKAKINKETIQKESIMKEDESKHCTCLKKNDNLS